MGGTYSTYVRVKNTYKILVGKPEGREDVENLGVYGKIILKLATEIGLKVMNSIRVDQDRDQFWAPVNTIIKPRFP
jgi:hypothetical protein